MYLFKRFNDCKIYSLFWVISCWPTLSHTSECKDQEGTFTDRGRQTAWLLVFNFSMWAEDSASGDARHGAVLGNEAYATNGGGNKHKHTRKVTIASYRHTWRQGFLWTVDYKTNNCTKTHTHISYANEFQRLLGMWAPSSLAHILFPNWACLFPQRNSMATDERLWLIAIADLFCSSFSLQI